MAEKNLGGRPEHAPTPALREKVSVTASAGWTHEEIAILLRISKPTLLKYYEFELSIGALEKRSEVLDALRSAALKGNVAAQKELLRMEAKLAAPPITEERPEPMGKKAQAQADAKTAADGTEWGVLLDFPGRQATP